MSAPILMGIISLIFTGMVNAGEEGLALSYRAQNPEREMAESASVLITWAEGELEEHAPRACSKTGSRMNN